MSTVKNWIFKSAFLLTAGFPSPSVADYQCNLVLLGNYAFSLNGARSLEHTDYWMSYKNSGAISPKSSRKVVNLSDSKIFEESDALSVWVENQSDRYWEIVSFTVHDELILSLQSGDQIQLGQDIFTLGRFLGAGNMTHIFELVDPFQNLPAVIRLPFLSMKALELQLLGHSRLASARGKLFEVSKKLLKLANRFPEAVAKPLFIDPTGALTIQERIWVEENGLEFFNRLLKINAPMNLNQKLDSDGEWFKRKHLYSIEDQRRLNLLIERMDQIGSIYNPQRDYFQFRFLDASQYVWGSKESKIQQWYLVDVD